MDVKFWVFRGKLLRSSLMMVISKITHDGGNVSDNIAIPIIFLIRLPSAKKRVVALTARSS